MKNKYKVLTYKFNNTDMDYEVSYYDCVKEYMSDYMRAFNLPEEEHIEKVDQIMELLNNVDYTKFVDHNEDAIKELFKYDAIEHFNDEYFICHECGGVFSKSEESEYEQGLCGGCCQETQNELAFWDDYNREVDDIILSR